MRLPDGVKTVADRLSAARLNSQEDQVRRHVLRGFASGTTPTTVTLAEQCGVSSRKAREILLRLMAMDLLLLDRTGEAVLAAYPFSSTPTPHRVRLMGREVFALCAVDALGIPAMLRETAEISSRCAHCESKVEVQAQPDTLSQYHSSEIAVWFPESEDDCCPVAQSRCPNISFFCTDEHLKAWRWANGYPSGVVLSLLEAFEVGRVIFGSLLAEPES
ncbi:MAG: alkylmercury lyase family protein [Candidatus Methylomirabilales bacterium]